MHTVDASRARLIRLSADIPSEVAEEFAARAAQLHRSSRAQLRVLIEEFLNEQDSEPPVGAFTGRTAL